MPVYIINNMTIHDRAGYDRYLRAFMGVFRKFNGEVLLAADQPQPVEGTWPYDRTIMLRFPDREEAQRWIDSPEYQAIAKDRWASTVSNVVILDGLPAPDPRHRPFADLVAGLRALPAPPKDRGRLALIVARRADGSRETPVRVRLTREEGVPGDDWRRRPPQDPDAQLAVMRHPVAELIAGGQPLTVFGDNLFVDLDISTGNLPAGTRLRVGEAVVEVTPKPHNGCRKFLARFGPDGLRFAQAPETRPLNLRGIYWKVIEPGAVEVGCEVVVLERPASAPAG